MINFILPSALANRWLTELPRAQVTYTWIAGGKDTGCPNCLALDGEVRTLEEWLNTITPGSPNLSCSGKNCGCRLEQTIQPISGRALQTILRHGYYSRLYFGDNVIRHIDLDPPGRSKPQPVPPSYACPQALPDLIRQKGRSQRGWR